jgi:hypothetical protein
MILDFKLFSGDLAIIFEKILFGNREKMFFHGVQIETPTYRERNIEWKVLQIIYHKYVSKKNNTKSVKHIKNNKSFG